MVGTYNPSTFDFLEPKYTPSSRLLEFSDVQFEENQLASNTWGVLYPDKDVSTGAVDVLKQSGVVQVRLKQILSHVCSGWKPAATDKALHSPGYYCLSRWFQGLKVGDRVEEIGKRHYVRDRFLLNIAVLEKYDISWWRCALLMVSSCSALSQSETISEGGK